MIGMWMWSKLKEKLLPNVWCFLKCVPCTLNSRHTCICYMSMETFFSFQYVCFWSLPPSSSFSPLPAWYMAKTVPVALLVPLRCCYQGRKKRGNVDMWISSPEHWFLVNHLSFVFIAPITKKQIWSCLLNNLLTLLGAEKLCAFIIWTCSL